MACHFVVKLLEIVCVCVCFIYIYYIILLGIFGPVPILAFGKYVGTLEIASDDNTLLQVASPRLQGSMSKAKAVLAARPVAGGAWENSITSFGQH